MATVATVSATDPGCGHLHLTISYNGETRQVTVMKSALEAPVSEMDIIEDMVLKNLGVCVRQAQQDGIVDWAEIIKIIESWGFKV